MPNYYTDYVWIFYDACFYVKYFSVSFIIYVYQEYGKHICYNFNSLLEKKGAKIMSNEKVVLVVEQNQEVRTDIEQILKKTKYTTFIEPTAKEVIDKYHDIVKNAKQIVLIVNIMLDTIIDGEMNGTNLINEFKKINPNLRGIVISSIQKAETFYDDNLSLVTTTIQKGAFDYIPSPFYKTELLNRLKLAFNENETEIYNYLAEKKITNDALSQILNLIKQGKAQHLAKIIKEKDLFTLFTPEELIVLLEKEIGQKAAPMQKPTVLVIDDEPRINSLIKIFLNSYKVLLANDGQEGLEMLKKEAVDIILLDIKMPGLSGIDLIPEIQKINSKADILMLTAYKDRESAIQSIRKGAISYITKPFSKNDLNKEIDKVAEIRYHKQVLPELIGRIGGK
jgi:DNA-binding NtrC family response regulator